MGQQLQMNKSKNGGNKEGIGVYEMLKMDLYHPWLFCLVLLMIKLHMNNVAKKILGVY